MKYKMILQMQMLGLEWEYPFQTASDSLAVKYAEVHAKSVLSTWPMAKSLILFNVETGLVRTWVVKSRDVQLEEVMP